MLGETNQSKKGQILYDATYLGHYSRGVRVTEAGSRGVGARRWGRGKEGLFSGDGILVWEDASHGNGQR